MTAVAAPLRGRLLAALLGLLLVVPAAVAVPVRGVGGVILASLLALAVLLFLLLPLPVPLPLPRPLLLPRLQLLLPLARLRPLRCLCLFSRSLSRTRSRSFSFFRLARDPARGEVDDGANRGDGVDDVGLSVAEDRDACRPSLLFPRMSLICPSKSYTSSAVSFVLPLTVLTVPPTAPPPRPAHSAAASAGAAPRGCGSEGGARIG